MDHRRIAAVAAALAISAAAYSQQITRIAVVDLPRIIMAYSSESKEVKAFEQKKALVQADIDRMSAEITRLMGQKADADKAGDKVQSASLRSEIEEKARNLNGFVSAKQAELDEEASRLASSNEFTQDLYRQIQTVAEMKGFSLVLNLKSRDSVMNSVLWYSPMIDITGDVIQALQTAR
jgi:Skp family chaperone for outer membrane proteins